MSVAPRSSRLNSSIFPRLRSQPIHDPSRGFHWRWRWKRKKRSPRPSDRRRLRASMPSWAAARIASSSGMSRAGASVKSPRIAKWMCGSRLPRASTSRCSTSSLDLGHAGEQRGHDHHRPRVRGNPVRELEAGEPPRRGQARGQPLHEGDGQVAGGQEQQQRDHHLHPARRALPSRVGHAGPEPAARSGARWSRGRRPVAWPKTKRRTPLAQPRPVGDVRLQVPAALPDEVVADVGGAVPGARRSPRPGARSPPRAGRRAPGPRRSDPRALPPPGGSGRGSGSPSPRNGPRDPAGARAPRG